METRFENLVAPLSELEFENLKESIKAEGCRDAIVTWNGIILDGHNRYRICTELNIPFKTIKMSFEDEEHAHLWMVKNQLARRNIKTFQKCEMIYPLEKMISEEVLERKREANSKARQGEKSEVWTNLPKPQNTVDYVAGYIDVSPTQWKKAKYIIENGDEDLKNKIRNGKTSIHAAYKKLKFEEADKKYEPIVKITDGTVRYTEKPERNPHPFPFVKDQVMSTMEGMLRNLEQNLSWLRDERRYDVYNASVRPKIELCKASNR